MAAMRFGIPINTLNHHYRGNAKAPITWTDKTHNIRQLCIDQCVGVNKSITAGHPMVLTYDEEKKIVEICQAMQDLGFGLMQEIDLIGGTYFSKGGHCRVKERQKCKEGRTSL